MKARPFDIRVFRIWIAVPVLISGAALPSWADVIYPEQLLAVKPRLIDDKDPLGVRWGTFIVRPVLSLGTQYDDNVFRTENNAQSDMLTEVKPALALQSGWLRHALSLSAMGNLGYFKEYSGENYRDYALTAAGQYDVAEDTFFTGGVSYLRQHQSRDGGGDFVTGDSERGNYKTFSQVIGFTRALNFLKLKIFGRNSHTEISSESAATDSDDFIDRDTQSLLTVLSYDFTPGTGIFLSNTLDTTDYSLPNGFSGNSDGQNWRLGLSYADGGIWSGNIFGGFLHRTYSDGTKDTKDPYFGARLSWAPWQRTQITLTLDRQFTDTTSESAAGIIRTTHRLELKHSITPLVTGNATLGYDNNEYVGAGSNGRKADFFYTGAGVDYKVTERAALRLGYDYRERMSNRPNDDYTDNRVLMSVVFNQ